MGLLTLISLTIEQWVKRERERERERETLKNEFISYFIRRIL